MDLRLDVSERGDWAVLHVGGEIDVATAPLLRERLLRLVADRNHHLVVDLEAVDFIDSTGLGVLIGALKRVRTKDGDLRLVCSDQRVRKIFDITGLDKVFHIGDSVEESVA